MKKFLTLLILGLGVVGLAGYWFKPVSKVETKPETSTLDTVDYKAGFAIFTQGTFRIFTASMYHNLSPDVYIESSNPNTVNIKRVEITWNDFFKTLPMKLTRDCLTTGTGQTFCTEGSQTLKFYINGQLDAGALNKKINAGDKLLVSYGDEDELEIKEQLEKIPDTK